MGLFDKIFKGLKHSPPTTARDVKKNLAGQFKNIYTDTKLTSLYFAIDFLDKAGYNSLYVKDFVHIVNDGKNYDDYKTMTAGARRYLVAFTDLVQLAKGPPSTHRHLTPDEYVPIIKNMPFDGIIVNVFDKKNLNIIFKGSICAAAAENDAKYLSDSELMNVFAEYFNFAISEGFITEQDNPKYKAYFDTINAATLEMLNNPKLFNLATKREQAELVDMCNNRIPEITNALICGLIFCVGKFAVVQSSLLCVDFSEAIPNCIAVYLLLVAQKIPEDKRILIIDAGDGTDKQPLTDAMKTISICDPNWKYKIF